MAEQPKSQTPPVTAWTYLNLAMNSVLIVLCMFLLRHVQEISRRVRNTEQQVQTVARTVEKIESYVANMPALVGEHRQE